MALTPMDSDPHMRLLLPLIVALAPLPAAAQSTWEFEYVTAQNADEITSCNAAIWFTDGGLVTRLYGEALDFFFTVDELSLPADQELGTVQLEFKSQSFTLGAWSVSSETGTTTAMFLPPEEKDYSPILSAIRFASEMGITFPDGSGYAIPLTGSDNALRQASDCWASNPTGPGTGGKNPFTGAGGNGGTDGNPFN